MMITTARRMLVDTFPLDETETTDYDGDGAGDNGDAFPFDPG